MEYTQENRICSITTTLGKDVFLINRFEGHEGISQLFNFEMELLTPDDSIDFDSIIGTGATLTMLLSDGSTKYLNGLIARISQGGADKRFVSYRFEIVPWLWLLTRRSDCRIFQDKSVPEIIEQVFSDLGLSDYELNLTGTYDPREYCVQYRETDFSFITRLMEDEGIFYYFKHEDGKHTLLIGDSPEAHEPCPVQPDALYAASEDKPEEEDHINSWSIKQELHSGKYSIADYNFETPNVSLLVNASTKSKVSVNKSLELYDYHPGQYLTVDKGEAYAKKRIEEQEAGALVIGGRGNCRSFVSGYRFNLQGYYRTDFDKKPYLLTSIDHSFSQPATFETGESSAVFYENSFSCIPHSIPYRPPRVTQKPRISGPQTAVVVGPSGEEIYCDKYGRVKVLFHWDRNSSADESSSCWVRVSENWAGKKWGTLFLPRIGQEVVVDFLEGDPDRPLITGRVYNAQQMPPCDLPGDQTKSTIKTLSSKGGGGFNEIRFEDKKGSEEILIHAEKNFEATIKEDEHESVGGNRHLTVGSDQLELVEGDKHLTVKGDHNEKIDGTLSLQAGMDIQEKAGMNHALEAGTEIHLKAGMNLILEAGTSITLKAGGGFVVVGPAGVTISGSPILLNSGGAAGAGAGCSPDAPKEPEEAATSSAGETSQPPKATSYGPTAITLKQAASSGTPFCEKCEEAKRTNES